MSFNSKAYLEYEERRLEPDSVMVRGSHKRHTPTFAAAWKILDEMTPEHRERMAELSKELDDRRKQYIP